MKAIITLVLDLPDDEAALLPAGGPLSLPPPESRQVLARIVQHWYATA